MEGTTFWVLAVVASALVGMSKGGLPVVGMLSVPILSLVISPVVAAGLLLPIYVISDMFGLYAYRRAFDKRLVAILVPAAAVGIAVGWATARLVPESYVGAMVGVIGVAFALNLLIRRGAPKPARQAEVAPGVFWGILTGFTSFVSHAGAPPYQVYVLPLQLDKMVFAGTATIVFACVNAMKLLPYWALGQLSADNLRVAAILAVPAVAAVFAGVWLVRVIPQALFFKAVTWALLAVSLELIWKVVAG